MPPDSTADVFWSSRPTLMTAGEVARFLDRSEATVVSLARKHEIGAYKVAGKWLIAAVDLRGFAATDSRALKSDLRLVIDPVPEFTGDVGAALAQLPDRMSTSAVAEVLRIDRAKLPGLGLGAGSAGNVERDAVVVYLRSVSNFGHHYSAVS